jgi:hypothetical protein
MVLLVWNHLNYFDLVNYGCVLHLGLIFGIFVLLLGPLAPAKR